MGNSPTMFEAARKQWRGAVEQGTRGIGWSNGGSRDARTGVRRATKDHLRAGERRAAQWKKKNGFWLKEGTFLPDVEKSDFKI